MNSGCDGSSERLPIEMLSERSPFSWLRERDIDLLVCAELHANGGFARLLGHRISRTDVRFRSAWVSHSELDGESDLVVAFESNGRHVIALIENKIAAPFQPDQAKRYAARASRWSTKGTHVLTVLLAPGDYMLRTDAKSFDVQLSYEEVATVLPLEGDKRSTFLADAMCAGVEQSRRGDVAN